MILGLRVYTLKPGTRVDFERLVREQNLPMLQQHGIRVVAARPSLHDEESFCLLRAFASIAERDRQFEGFYGSEEWLSPYDAPVMAMIDHYSTCVFEADETGIEAFAAAIG